MACNVLLVMRVVCKFFLERGCQPHASCVPFCRSESDVKLYKPCGVQKRSTNFFVAPPYLPGVAPANNLVAGVATAWPNH